MRRESDHEEMTRHQQQGRGGGSGMLTRLKTSHGGKTRLPREGLIGMIRRSPPVATDDRRDPTAMTRHRRLELTTGGPHQRDLEGTSLCRPSSLQILVQ
jgi:hypothetical protein